MGGLNQIISSLSGQAPVPRLTYNPGPGIYSRLERAVEAMPENVRVQELPGLLKRYKEGVPGWELKATNLDEVIAGRDVVPREELLARVREASPVYTHGEVVLRNPEMSSAWGDLDASAPAAGSARIGQGAPSGVPKYQNYGQGGKDYTELLLTQPGAERLLAPPHAGTDPEFQVAPRVNYGSHWSEGTKDAVAHARFDTHGDALRINELQSDLGIHNRKARERAASGEPPVPAGWADTGSPRSGEELPFPLEDAWADLLIKRLALEAARQGHRAIEVASPRAIADKVGGNIDNYEHFYGKVVPGALERLGRKLGGMTERAVPEYAPDIAESWKQGARRLNSEVADYERAALWKPEVVGYGERPSARLQNFFGVLVDTAENAPDAPGAIGLGQSQQMFESLQQATGLSAADAAKLMPEIMYNAERAAKAQAAYRIAHHGGKQIGAAQTPPPGRRYVISDEMRRRIIEQGIGASVLAPLLMQDE